MSITESLVCQGAVANAKSENSATTVEESTARRWTKYAQHLYPLAVLSMIPIALTSSLWLEVWRGVRPRATNGSGHFAIARLYDQMIFPDTFGWVNAYFCGMPFPNFYPPLFYWCVALLHHTHLFSFAVAFKIVMALPLLLLPAAIWTLAWAVSGKDRVVAHCASGCSLLLLFVPQFQLKMISGLDYFSTLVVGLYTQPLGFVLLIAWYVIYLGAHRRRWRLAASSVLLALTVLANFFNAITAALFVAGVLVNDLRKYHSTHDDKGRAELKRAALTHLISPLIAVGLALFWLAPMLGEYSYLVTRPYIVPFGELVPTAMYGWYGASCVGMVYSLRRRQTGALWSYTLVCLVLSGGVLFSGTLAPRWFPLQSYRFLSTLDFLLAVPVGLALTVFIRRLNVLLANIAVRRETIDTPGTAHRARGSSLFSMSLMLTALVIIGALMAKTPSRTTLTFYQHEDNEKIGGVLRFAEQHRDGRYLIELPEPTSAYMEGGYDSRALSSYLGLQGNESLNIIFRESSPNVLFVSPQVNAFSTHADSHGISSVLSDDQDFMAQPLAQHLERARLLGAKYIVIATPAMKDRLTQEPEVRARFDCGAWSVFELRHDPPAPVHALNYRPALVVSNFSLKGRRQNEYGFVRLAEEQFADDWFEVLLARSPETKIDHLHDIEQFGALVLDTYDCDNEDAAYARLRDYARERTLVLLESDEPLYHRIKESLAEFPRARLIERAPEVPGAWVESLAPSSHYDTSSIRQTWRAIRHALDEHKIVNGEGLAFALVNETTQRSLDINSNSVAPVDLATAPGDVAVLIDKTYHPNWQRNDGGTIYAATPFSMLTFIRQPTHLTFARTRKDQAALMGSAATFALLCGFIAWPPRRFKWLQ